MYKTEVQNDYGFYAKVVAHSNCDGTELCTMELRYPRFIHAEFMTHRMFSRNASSSRAIPVKKLLQEIDNAPAMPIHWGSNKPGMQAGEEITNLVDVARNLADAYYVALPREEAWKWAAYQSCDVAEGFDSAGYHKQVVNRLTEPFQFITVVVTATEWDNFFKLRLHPDAQPEIHELARLMEEAMNTSYPTFIEHDEWHTPYVTEKDISPSEALKASVARCARVSYKNHDKSDPDLSKDIALHDMLLEAGHMSPFEHQATPMDFDVVDIRMDGIHLDKGVTHLDRRGTPWSGNFRNWIQYRQAL